jgi:hypothetical protein
MTNKERVLATLESTRGDDLYRARAAFRGLSAERMAQQYGASGRTRAEIIAGYEEQNAKLDALIAYAREALP